MNTKHMKQTNPNLINTMDMNMLNSLLKNATYIAFEKSSHLSLLGNTQNKISPENKAAGNTCFETASKHKASHCVNIV